MAGLAIALTLDVLAAAILCSTLYLRGRMREEIVHRNAEFLSAVFGMQVKADQDAGTFLARRDALKVTLTRFWRFHA